MLDKNVLATEAGWQKRHRRFCHRPSSRNWGQGRRKGSARNVQRCQPQPGQFSTPSRKVNKTKAFVCAIFVGDILLLRRNLTSFPSNAESDHFVPSLVYNKSMNLRRTENTRSCFRSVLTTRKMLQHKQTRTKKGTRIRTCTHRRLTKTRTN